MKFLCVECDEPMSLEEARGPDDGAMTVVFQCPSCEQQTAMLTNPMETQVVRSLGVSIGEEETSSSPMEMVRSSLAEQGDGAPADSSEGDEVADDSSDSGSECPFTSVVESAYEEEEAPDEPQWTEAAEKRLSNIPSFARSMARKSIEQHAEEQGYATIDTDVMDEVKGQFGMI